MFWEYSGFKKKLGEIIYGETYMIIIRVLIKDNIDGGEFSINFCDLSKKMYEENYFSEESPSYRTAFKEINIFGKCIYRKCPEAYNKEVIIPLGNKNHFNLIN